MPQHPTYAFPQLVEAVCELRFVSSPEQPWQPAFLGEFYKAAQHEYPSLEPVAEQAIGFLVTPNGAHVQPNNNPRTKFKLTRSDGSFIFIVSEGLISVSAVNQYAGWDMFKAEIRKLWEYTDKIARPAEISQVGMRYINRIARRSVAETPDYWIKSSKFICDAVVKSIPPFLSRVESTTSSGGKTLVTLAHDASSTPGHLLFDIDTISTSSVKSEWVTLSNLIDAHHDQIYSIFDSSLSDNYRLLLKGAD